MARGIGSIQNAINLPRPPALPTHAIVGPGGNVIGFAAPGSGPGADGGDVYGGAGFGGAGGAWSGAANDANEFSGGYPGVGNYTGPNPGPTDPDFGYV
jgi:hypothetical protein